MKIISKNNLRYSLKHKNISVLDITDVIKKDKEIFYGFQANIAVVFQDCYDYFKYSNKRKYISKKDLHEISNEAAIRFLNLWIN